MTNRLIFIVKCQVSASMKKINMFCMESTIVKQELGVVASMLLEHYYSSLSNSFHMLLLFFEAVVILKLDFTKSKAFFCGQFLGRTLIPWWTLINFWQNFQGERLFYGGRLLSSITISNLLDSEEYQLVNFKELDLKSVPDVKVCTNVLQQWHVPGEAANSEPVLFSNLTFEKSDFEKDKNKNRKRPLVTGDRKHCSSPLFSRKPSKDKIKKLMR